MQTFGRNYAKWFNLAHRRCGTLWEGRYKSCLVDSETYLLACHRYIELNPVRAWMVSDPADYLWSSYRANALGQPDPILELNRPGFCRHSAAVLGVRRQPSLPLPRHPDLRTSASVP